ncbi:hypothetical protein CPB97_002096, partial [Podila verticillata]
TKCLPYILPTIVFPPVSTAFQNQCLVRVDKPYQPRYIRRHPAMEVIQELEPGLDPDPFEILTNGAITFDPAWIQQLPPRQLTTDASNAAINRFYSAFPLDPPPTNLARFKIHLAKYGMWFDDGNEFAMYIINTLLNDFNSAFSSHTLTFTIDDVSITAPIPNKSEFILTSICITYSIDIVVVTLGNTPSICRYPSQDSVSTLLLVHVIDSAQGLSYYINVGATGTKILPPIPQSPIQRQLLGAPAIHISHFRPDQVETHKRKREPLEGWTEEELEDLLRTGFTMAIRSVLEDIVESHKPGQSATSAKDRVFRNWMDKVTRLPPKAWKGVTDRLDELGIECTVAAVTRKTNSFDRMEIFKEIVRDSFETIWSEVVESISYDESQASQAFDEKSTLCLTLPQAIRPDHHEFLPEIIETLVTKQRALTHIKQDLMFLNKASWLLIFEGHLYESGPQIFDLSPLFPTWFKLPTNNKFVSIAPIPENLQAKLARKTHGTWTAPRDIQELSTHYHLQDLHRQFIARTARRSSTIERPNWDKLQQLIQARLPDTKFSDPVEGMSNTTTQHIHEYATDIANIWSGPSYNKLIHNVSKWLIRMHLDHIPTNTDQPASVDQDNNADHEESVDPELLFPDAIVGDDDQPWAVIDEPDPAQTNIHIELTSSVADSSMDVDAHPAYPPTPASRMNPLIKALTTMLTSPTIQGDVTVEDIKSFMHEPSKYPAHELEIVAHLATTLRPYVGKKRQRSDGKPPDDAVEHGAIRGPFMFLAGIILRLSGHNEDIKAWCPDPQIGQFDTLHLNMTGVYEVFFSDKGAFRVTGPDGLITSLLTAKKDPDLLFQSLLDMEHIHRMCKERHVTFANRYGLSNRYTSRLRPLDMEMNDKDTRPSVN